MTKQQAENFLDVTSVYDLNALRQIAEGMGAHSWHVESAEQKEVMDNVRHAISEFIALRIRAQVLVNMVNAEI